GAAMTGDAASSAITISSANFTAVRFLMRACPGRLAAGIRSRPRGWGEYRLTSVWAATTGNAAEAAAPREGIFVCSSPRWVSALSINGALPNPQRERDAWHLPDANVQVACTRPERAARGLELEMDD